MKQLLQVSATSARAEGTIVDGKVMHWLALLTIFKWMLGSCVEFSGSPHGFSLGIPASDGGSLAPASDDVRCDGFCS